MGGINSCECMGCGKQEQFYNCADVAIKPNGGTSTAQPFSYLPVKPHPSFLSSPENQSYIFLQRIREQLPVFPWPRGRLIPHNMMFPSSTSSRYSTQRGGSTSDPFMANVFIDHQGSLPDARGIDSRFLPARSPFLHLFNMSQIDRIAILANKTFIHSFPSHIKVSDRLLKSSQTTPRTETASPIQEYRDYKKWNFTQIIPTPSSLKKVSPKPVTRINNTGSVKGDSILYPLFAVAPKPTTVPPPLRPLPDPCDVFSPKFQCKGKGAHAKTPDIENWCLRNCRAGNCVKDICVCGCGRIEEEINQCHALGVFVNIPGMNEWCKSVCVRQKCPSNICDLKTCL